MRQVRFAPVHHLVDHAGEYNETLGGVLGTWRGDALSTGALSLERLLDNPPRPAQSSGSPATGQRPSSPYGCEFLAKFVDALS